MGALLKVTLVGALLTLLGERIFNFSHRTLIFNEVEPVDLPGCQLVKGIEAGSEDIDVLPNGLAFISTGVKFPGVKSFAPDKPGEIMLLDLEDGGLSPSPLPISEGFDVSSFNPRGLSTYIDEKDGTVYLFVVNHPHLHTIIEIFKFQEKERSLLHLKSVRHELLTSINDIVAVGPESFYGTIDFYFSNAHMKIAELFFGFPWTGVVYYSPGDVRQVATGLNNGNGITISNDKKYIYAADFTGHTINVFKKNEDWSLTPVKRDICTTQIKIATAVDSLMTSNNDEYEKLVTKQNAFLTKFRMDLETAKRQKWHRDLQDYTSGRVYNWGQLSTSTRHTRKQKDSQQDNRNRTTGAQRGENDTTDVPFLGLDIQPATDQPVEGDTDTEGLSKTRSQKTPKPPRAKTKKNK